MKIFNKIRFISLIVSLLLVTMMVVPNIGLAESIVKQPTVDLGTTSTFAVLAGQSITNTGVTTISGIVGGDVGLYPGSAITGATSLVVTDGAIHINDAVAIKAKTDLVTAYDDAAGRTNVTRIATELGGKTLYPGVYDSEDGVFQITGTLTLDAQGDPEGVFIFKTASTLNTAVGSNIELKNEARFCRTFWKVGSSATLGTSSHFVGHIFAMTSISLGNGATVEGQLLARVGSVTLDNNTITNGYCGDTSLPPIYQGDGHDEVEYVEDGNGNDDVVEDQDQDNDDDDDDVVVEDEILITPVETIESATLNVVKHVINDDGGTAIASDFNLHVKIDGIDVEQSPSPGKESPGTKYTLDAGIYKISEDDFEGYTLSYSGDSDSNGNITLAPGDNKTVTLTNNDNPLPPVIIPTIPVEVTTTTITGGELPYTSTGYYSLLLIGLALTLIGAVGWGTRKFNA